MNAYYKYTRIVTNSSDGSSKNTKLISFMNYMTDERNILQ